MNGNKEDLFTDHGAPPAYGLSDGGSASASTGPATFGSVTSTKFGCVALSLTDRIRLINIPTDVVTEVEKAVRGAWRKGIQQTRRYGSSYEIKLHGRPWSYSRMSDHMIEPRRLVTRVLQTLFDKGWVMKASVDVSQKERDKGMKFLPLTSAVATFRFLFPIGCFLKEMLRIVLARLSIRPVSYVCLPLREELSRVTNADKASARISHH